MTSNELTLDQKLGTVKNLPTLPLVLRQVQKVMHDPKSTMVQIAAVVATDQALTSRTMRLVNSAFYGMRERVTSISHGIVILGLNALNSLMIGLSVVKLFKDSSITGFEPAKYWEHCFGTALLAKYMAEALGKKDMEQFFTAGLLHDLGKIVLDQFLHDEFSQALLCVKKRKMRLFECEKTIIGFDHGDVGAWLGQKWGLPEAFIASMGCHHGRRLPEALREFQEDVRLVRAANELCNGADIGASGDLYHALPDHVSVEGLNDLGIKDLIDRARSEVKATMLEWNNAL